MCGISGFCNFDQDSRLIKKPLWEERLTNMRQTLSHRGNDSSGLYLSSHAGLSHARLSTPRSFKRHTANGPHASGPYLCDRLQWRNL